MSAMFDRRTLTRELPGLLLGGAAWVLLCFRLADIVWVWWTVLAFPAAVLAVYGLRKTRLRIPVALILLAVLPWVVRLPLLIVSGRRATLLPTIIDNAWLLTFPYLYVFSVLHYLKGRYPGLGYIEGVVLLGVSTAVMETGDLWPARMSAAAGDSLDLAVTAVILTLCLLGFISSRAGVLDKKGGGRAVVPDDSRSVLSHRVAFPPSSRISSNLAYLLILAALLIVLLFAADRFRREQSLQSGGGLLASELFRFDFNDVLSLEPEISLNSELTMLYREDGPPAVRYLRRFTLSGWDENRGFFRDGSNETDFPHLADSVPSLVNLPRSVRSLPTGDYMARVPVNQEYYLIALDPQSFFAVNYPVGVEPWSIWDNASFTRAYAVHSLESAAGPWELTDALPPALGEGVLEYYLAGGDESYYRDLADKITAGAESDWERAWLIEQWFLDDFFYSLRPGLAPDGDQLGWFLRETRRGYCSYFAFAMARLCRAAGIPARVAVGFVTDPETSTLGFVPVRSDQAHAWVEVWFQDYGWITFDPTSSTLAPGEEYRIEFIPPDRWLSLIEEVLTRSGEVSVILEEEGADAEDLGLWDRVGTFARERPSLLVALILLLLTLVALPGRLIPGIRLLADRLSRSPRRRCIGSWQAATAYLIRSGCGPGRRETMLEWAERLGADILPDYPLWTRLYLKAQFSPRFDPADGEESRRLSRKVRREVRALPLFRRIAGVLGPGWKRGFR